jgi:indolepyruvate ferredoxin oxidoreductase beta subunit
MSTYLAAESPPSISSPPAKAISIAILAMGGEGGGVLADWIVDLAEHRGYYAQTTSVPGVAQRTGATIYYVEIFPQAESPASGQPPVLGLMPVPGEVDVVLASELMEAGRAIQRGLVTPDRTLLIASHHRVYSMAERTAIADARVDAEKLIEAADTAAKRFVHSDFARLAEEHRSVISASLFGALAAIGALPFQRDEFEQAIRRGGVGVESSLSAFFAGYAAAHAAAKEPLPKTFPQPPIPPAPRRLHELSARMARDFPKSAHAVLLPGIERLVDYQDEQYAAQYLESLEPIRDVDAQYGGGDFSLLSESARYLALWMSYEDAARVADLKIRRTRFERVRKEVKADSTHIVEIYEFLHPGIEEITDILPARFSRFLLRTRPLKRLIERFTSKGRIVQTTSLFGFLLMYSLAEMRRLRRRSLRFQREHQAIDQWLAEIPPIAALDYALALELAECPRIVKGYGETHARGAAQFQRILSALPRLRGRSDAAPLLKRLREAALADESGKKFNAAFDEVNA